MIDTIIISILHMRRLRPKEVMDVAKVRELACSRARII